VADLIDAAKRRFDLGFSTAGGSVLKRAREAQAAGVLLEDPMYSALATCPACGSACEINGYPASSSDAPGDTAKLEADYLFCGLCGLALMDRDDLAAAGLPPSQPLRLGITNKDVNEYWEAEIGMPDQEPWDEMSTHHIRTLSSSCGVIHGRVVEQHSLPDCPATVVSRVCGLTRISRKAVTRGASDLRASVLARDMQGV
jgi:hypothetical protein